MLVPGKPANETARVQALHYRALMFVSGNAAQHFLDPNTVLALASQAPAAIKK